MRKKALNEFECKKAKAGETLYKTDYIGENVLLFVSAGKLIICDKETVPITEVDEGYFVLLPAEKCYIATAVTDTQTILMHAGLLSEMITEDPEWNPDHPVVLPIFPALAHTLCSIENYEKERRNSLN